MQRYLAKIEFDCNDADYVYGLNVLTEEEAQLVRDNSKKLVSFGSCDFGEREAGLGDCVRLKPITEEEYNVLKNLGLLKFGESLRLHNLHSLETKESKNSDLDENEVTIKPVRTPVYESYFNTRSRVVIQRTTSSGEVYFLMEKNSGSTREIVHQACDKSFEKITRKERATSYILESDEAQKLLSALNSQSSTSEFELIKI